MPRTLLEANLQKPAMSQAAGCLIAIPVILLVVVAVNLFIGESQLPREVRGTTPFFAVGAVLTGLLAGFFWWRSRIRLVLVENEAGRFLEIYDPGAPLVLEADTLTVRYGWASLYMPKTGKITLLIAGIFEGDELVVSLTETWGGIHTPPPGWPGDFSLEGHLAKASYTLGGRSFLPALVTLLEGRE